MFELGFLFEFSRKRSENMRILITSLTRQKGVQSRLLLPSSARYSNNHPVPEWPSIDVPLSQHPLSPINSSNISFISLWHGKETASTYSWRSGFQGVGAYNCPSIARFSSF